MKERFLSISSIFTAIFASLCWTGGVILASLGLGSVGTAYFANMSKYKPLFTILTGGLLYWSYSIMERKNPNKINRIVFFVSAIISLLVLYYPTFLLFLDWKQKTA